MVTGASGDAVHAPAGWYDDVSNVHQWRYWDGTAWTDHYAPKHVEQATVAAYAPSGTVPTYARAPKAYAPASRDDWFEQLCWTPAVLLTLGLMPFGVWGIRPGIALAIFLVGIAAVVAIPVKNRTGWSYAYSAAKTVTAPFRATRFLFDKLPGPVYLALSMAVIAYPLIGLLSEWLQVPMRLSVLIIGGICVVVGGLTFTTNGRAAIRAVVVLGLAIVMFFMSGLVWGLFLIIGWPTTLAFGVPEVVYEVSAFQVAAAGGLASLTWALPSFIFHARNSAKRRGVEVDSRSNENFVVTSVPMALFMTLMSLPIGLPMEDSTRGSTQG